MNTYTVRALDPADTALIRGAAALLASYDQRKGMTTENNLSGTWDLMQAARLAENLRLALALIERITRPAAAPEPPAVLDGETALLCYPEAAREPQPFDLPAALAEVYDRG